MIVILLAAKHTLLQQELQLHNCIARVAKNVAIIYRYASTQILLQELSEIVLARTAKTLVA